MGADDTTVIKQHLIDPEICIRCNTCEATCPVNAITHDDNNYVVDASICNLCMACIAPCPTGSIDNWRSVPKLRAYSPAELDIDDAARFEGELNNGLNTEPADALKTEPASEPAQPPAQAGSTLPPWSAAHAYTNLYGPRAAQKTITATVTGNVRVTEVSPNGLTDYDTHHLVLDFGATPFPVLEGQSIAVLAPGVDEKGRAHHARQYSVASPRNGERPGYNNLSLTIKRVLEDHQGRPVRGVASNFMCDRQVGDTVQLIGPFGASFLMPNHPGSHIVMICTGTGSAPMRAMTEWRRRLRAKALAGPGQFEGGKLLLFFGARTQQELPYFGPLQSLPKDFIDLNFAFSRTPGQPKKYVQDAMRERAADVALMLADPSAYFFVCGLKSMEEGVLLALRDIATQAGLDWADTATALRTNGRLHLETY